MLTMILTGLIFWVCSMVFPSHIVIDGIPALILTTILFYVVEYLVALLIGVVIIGAMFPSLVTEEVSGAQILTIIVLTISLFFVGMISILLLSKYLPGFWVDGKMTAFLLSLVPSLLTTKVSVNSND